MSRNENTHFALNPTKIDMSRSTFSRNSSLKTSFNVGDIVPFYVDEVLPGDTFDVATSKVVRMPSLLTPIMDNLYLDTYFFFVPNRLVWSHWREFCGENTQSAWIPKTEYEVPQITAPASTGWEPGTIADYFGIPIGVPGLSCNALPFRAYALIMNEWFRDQNLCDPLNFPVDDATVAGVNTGTFVTDVAKGGKPYKAAKYHDYFTSCLPAPQKGPDVSIPVGQAVNLPVMPLGEQAFVPAFDSSYATEYFGNLYSSDGSQPKYYSFPRMGSLNPSTANSSDTFAPAAISTSNNLGTPVNLWAVQSGNVPAATINQLRTAFQIQKLYERDARGGTRYIEILKSHFGVTSPDARLQRPEYLGGNRIPITINQVLQNSGTSDGSTPQGTPTGQSLTTDVHGDFKKSFVEHGFIIGVMVARYNHTYQQGLERFWSRKSRFDYYWPAFANLGEMAVLNKEIYAQGSEKDNEVFGYQEAWADYRYKPSRCTGEMRSGVRQSLDIWHLGDDYSNLPSLSADWIMEDGTVVDRVVAVQQVNSNQLWADIYIKNTCTRPMPLYSIPGLIDHH